jgi:sec-independent protein translocase protein TatA
VRVAVRAYEYGGGRPDRAAWSEATGDGTVFNLGWPEILIIVLVIVLLFGRGKISAVMGDVAKGIKSFRKGLSEPDEDAADAKADDRKMLNKDASLTDVAPRKDDAAKT